MLGALEMHSVGRTSTKEPRPQTAIGSPRSVHTSDSSGSDCSAPPPSETRSCERGQRLCSCPCTILRRPRAGILTPTPLCRSADGQVLTSPLASAKGVDNFYGYWGLSPIAALWKICMHMLYAAGRLPDCRKPIFTW